MPNPKTRTISFKVELREERFLQELAAKNQMSLSKYIRSRLLEDGEFAQNKNGEKESGKNLSQKNKIEQDLIKLMANSYNLLYKMAEKSLNQDEIAQIVQKSQEWLEKKQY